MSQFQVDSTQVAAAGMAVRASAEQIGTEVERMMRNLIDLQATWQGQAAGSFQQLIGRWRHTQEQVRLSLDEIQAALAAASQGYEEAEASAVRMFGRG